MKALIFAAILLIKNLNSMNIPFDDEEYRKIQEIWNQSIAIEKDPEGQEFLITSNKAIEIIKTWELKNEDLFNGWNNAIYGTKGIPCSRLLGCYIIRKNPNIDSTENLTKLWGLLTKEYNLLDFCLACEIIANHEKVLKQISETDILTFFEKEELEGRKLMDEWLLKRKELLKNSLENLY